MFWGVLKGFSEIQLILAVLDPPKVQKLPRFIQVLGLRTADWRKCLVFPQEAGFLRANRGAGVVTKATRVS